MKKFIEVSYFDANGKLIKRLVNTSHIFDVIPKGNKTWIRFVPTNDYEKTYPVTFEADETYEEVKELIKQATQ